MTTNTLTPHILIVDDDDAVRGFLEELLRDEGYLATGVASGEAALETLAARDFDLALIDLRLGGIGGMEVLAEVRRQAPDTIAVMLTAHASLDSAVQALRHGAYDYLFKPCKTVEIRECVHSGLRQRQQELQRRKILAQLKTLSDSLNGVDVIPVETPPPPTPPPGKTRARFLQRGDLIVDFRRHIITLAGHLLELSPTEFDLLAYILSEAPRVVPPQELVREVQGYESEAQEARDIVRSHIYHIRQKIEATTGRRDVIETVRGVGYTVGGS